jgi:hypothetical protein
MRHAETPESKTPDYIGTGGKIKQVSEVRGQELEKNRGETDGEAATSLKERGSR